MKIRPFSRLVRHTTLALSLTLATVISPVTSSAAEFRGLWVDAWGAGFKSSSEISTLVSRCTTYNYNAVIVQMRKRGDAYYMPQSPNLEPRATDVSSSFDALATLITQCHNANPRIEVHVWVPTMLIWGTQGTPPSQASHVYNSHPEYLMRNSSGATWIGEGYYVDPGHPGAGTWTYNMAKDIVSRYNIDGFHWDYIRYPTTNAGYNPTAISRYNAEFGLSGQPSSTDANFSNWRRRQVTDFLRWTNADLYEIKPNLVISASVFASRSDAYNARFQDWSAWNSEGLMDICMPMNYTTDNNLFRSRCDDIWLNQGVRRAYVGPGAYMNTPANTVTQLNYVRSKGFLGHELFSYRTPNSGTVNQTGTFQYIKTNFQPTYTGVPTLPWKTNPSKGIAKGTVTDQSSGQALYNATVTINTSPARTFKTEPHGKYVFYEVPAGTYPVSATFPGKGIGNGNINVSAGGVSTLNLVVPAGGGGGGNDIIIDNPSAVVTGTWSVGTSATDKYGSDYRHKGPGSGSAYLTFRPTLSTAGTYNVYEWHSQGSNRTTGATHNIVYNGGSTNKIMNQQINGGKWNILGTHSFASGNSGYVRITDSFSAGSVVIADAIRFTLATPADVIIDNSDSAFAASGSWSSGTSAVDKYGSNYRFRSTAAVTDPAQWNFTIPTTRSYQVFAWWSQGSNRSTSAPYRVYYSSSSTGVNRNQQINGGAWQSLGTYTMSAGSRRVELGCNTTTGYVVIADAIKLVPQ